MSFPCPDCGAHGKCQATRKHSLGTRRRWKCLANPKHRWTTVESVAAARRGVGTWPIHALVKQLRGVIGEMSAKLAALEDLLPKNRNR